MVAAALYESNIGHRTAGSARGGKSLAANARAGHCREKAQRRACKACNRTSKLLRGPLIRPTISFQDQGDSGDRSEARAWLYRRGGQRRLLHGYDENIGVSADCGCFQGEFVIVTAAGIPEPVTRERQPDSGERKLQLQSRSRQDNWLRRSALHVLVLGWVMRSSRPTALEKCAGRHRWAWI